MTKARVFIDFAGEDQESAFRAVAGFTDALRAAEILPEEIDVVQFTEADSAESCGVPDEHHFLVVGKRTAAHGPSVHALLVPEQPRPEAAAGATPAESASGLKPPTSAAPY